MSTNPSSPLRTGKLALVDTAFYDNVQTVGLAHRALLARMQARRERERTQPGRPMHADIADQDTQLVPVAMATVVEMPFQRELAPYLLVESAIREFWYRAGHAPTRVIVSYWNKLYLSMCGCDSIVYGDAGEIALEDDRQRAERLPHDMCVVIGNT